MLSYKMVDKSDRNCYSTDVSLNELRGGRRLSDGASAFISASFEARNLAENRVSGKDTYITCLIDDLRTSLVELGATVSQQQVESWALFIHESMSGDARGYHNIHRVFEISAGADPLQLLAVFFRDTINCTVDGGLSTKQSELVKSVMKEGFVLTNDIEANEQHPHLGLITSLFGVTAGQDLRDFKGLDAFLSAVLVSRTLIDTLDTKQIAQIVTCLEATIPFRGPDDDGIVPMDKLYSRLSSANKTFSLGLDNVELVKSIQRAADFSNRSLGNFASEDAKVFLDHTWSLLPERNASLRRSFLYTVHDFLEAVKDMDGFLTELDSSRIFTAFRGVPNASEMAAFNRKTTRNLALGRKYVRAELLSVSIVAAFATLTGGDAPMSFFTGDLPSFNHHSDRLGEDFPTFLPEELSDCDEQVYMILSSGRHCETNFDTRSSPAAAYVYACLGDEGVEKALRRVSCPMTAVMAKELLLSLPRHTIELIGRDIAKIAVSRAESVDGLLVDFFGH